MELRNPCGLDGFAFLEFSAPDKSMLHEKFTQLGFKPEAAHKNEDITFYRQGAIQFILNNAKDCQAAEHARTHGPGTCAMGFYVHDAEAAYEYALEHGAHPFEDSTHAHHGLMGIHAIGGSVIYFIDKNDKPFPHSLDYHPRMDNEGFGLLEIDHLTHNVLRGNMNKWAKFYESIFNFQEIRFFNIKGQMSGLVSRALASPCGKIKIPLNESKDDISQIEEFLHQYHGEGIQHIALSTENIYRTVHELRQQNIPFLEVPDTYYEMINDRLPWQREPLDKLQAEKILIDGDANEEEGLLLQIFTENMFGPVFFEIIQRKGNEGFGEGNFQALFEAMERDQVKRGTLKKPE